MVKQYRKLWTRGKLAAHRRRMLSLRLVGTAWGKMHTEAYRRLRRHAWEATGCLLRADGVSDELIRPEGLPGYAPELPGTAVPDP